MPTAVRDLVQRDPQKYLLQVNEMLPDGGTKTRLVYGTAKPSVTGEGREVRFEDMEEMIRRDFAAAGAAAQSTDGAHTVDTQVDDADRVADGDDSAPATFSSGTDTRAADGEAQRRRIQQRVRAPYGGAKAVARVLRSCQRGCQAASDEHDCYR